MTIHIAKDATAKDWQPVCSVSAYRDSIRVQSVENIKKFSLVNPKLKVCKNCLKKHGN
jgi:hypothetical protein